MANGHLPEIRTAWLRSLRLGISLVLLELLHSQGGLKCQMGFRNLGLCVSGSKNTTCSARPLRSAGHRAQQRSPLTDLAVSRGFRDVALPRGICENGATWPRESANGAARRWSETSHGAFFVPGFACAWLTITSVRVLENVKLNDSNQEIRVESWWIESAIENAESEDTTARVKGT